jgi:2-amino-4-hydroxy-6-hydroxymethyldihydropteridine diphosphokinase
MYSIYLGLGSNLGDRFENLSRTIDEIRLIANVRDISSVYETEPVSMDADNLFYNMAIGITSQDDPPLLLVKLKKIEKKIGRKLHIHNESRIIDIDILLYRGLAYEDHTVKIPHPELVNRRFVLEPLNEIAPTAIHPVLEKTIATLLRNCHDHHSVKRIEHHYQFSLTQE